MRGLVNENSKAVESPGNITSYMYRLGELQVLVNTLL